MIKVVHTTKELKFLIFDYIEKFGPNCDLNFIDVSEIRNMDDLFSGINSTFDGDISGWEVSHVESMCGMFQSSLFNGDISQWNVSNVEWMQSMFANSQFNGDISRWDVSKACDASAMFAGSQFVGDIDAWKLPKDAHIGDMFAESVMELKGLVPAWYCKMRDDPERANYWWWTPDCEELLLLEKNRQLDCEPPTEEELENLPF